MGKDYAEFYQKLFLSPIKVDELTEKHFPDYSIFEDTVTHNFANKQILITTTDISKTEIVDMSEKTIIKHPQMYSINILSGQKRDAILSNITLEDYIFYHSPYSYVSSKISNPFCVEFPKSQQNVEVFIHNNFSEKTLNKKTIVTKDNTTYQVLEKFFVERECIYAADYIIAENGVLNIVADLSEINSSSCSINYLFILEKNSNLNFSLLGLGTGKIYINLYTIIKGIGAQAKLGGCCLGKKGDETILLSYVNHRAPKNTSTVHINTVLFDKARNFFLGLIKVDKQGEEVDAYEINRNLLLSKEARIFSIPKLEIENNNLRCSHASSISSVDEEILFYLSSRGIEHAEIIKLVATGFLVEPLVNHNYDNIIEKTLDTLLKGG